MKKVWDIDRGDDPHVVGTTYYFEDKGAFRVVLWFKYKTGQITIAHECLHAANRILGRAGVKADWWNDEPQAYLMSTLIREATGAEL